MNNKKCLYSELDGIILELQRRLVDGVIPEKAYLAVLDDFDKTIQEAKRVVSNA